MNEINHTLQFYEDNADDFAAGTQTVDFSENLDHFLRLLPENAKILDFGCGAGRDTKYFLDRGYQTDAVDGSAQLCRIASEYCKITVRQMLFQDLDAHEEYDAIWACSSVLHLNKKELAIVLEKTAEALKDNGVLYTSFKYGDFEGIRNGRHFTDFTEDSFSEWIKAIPVLKITEHWISSDVRPGREAEKWLNLILRKEKP